MMRRLHSPKAEISKQNRVEPMAEGIAKLRPFTKTDVAHIIERRKELAARGMRDGELSRLLAAEMRRSAGVVIQKIRQLKAGGKLVDNENRKKRFDDEEVKLIIKRRKELAAEGRRDGEISRIVASGTGRLLRTVAQKIRELMKEGKLVENRNKRGINKFHPDEVKIIIRRRNELAKEGKRDWTISRILAGEMGRDAGVLAIKIRELVQEGTLDQNENKNEYNKFYPDEVDLIIRRRDELAAEGKNDGEISRSLAGEMGRKAKTIDRKIRELVVAGQLGQNSNKQEAKKFHPDEEELIIRRRDELAAEGKNDGEISRSLAGEMGMDSTSIAYKIRQLLREGKLKSNENKREMNRFSTDEEELIIRRRDELAAEGKNDGEISRSLAGEMGRNGHSIHSKIRKLLKEGKLKENRNNKESKPHGFYTEMSDNILIRYGRKFLTDTEITTRTGLEIADSGLYHVLRMRKLLDQVFASIDHDKHKKAVQGVLDAMDSFGDDR